MRIGVGHVGLVVGSKAHKTLWPEATRWLSDHNRQPYRYSGWRPGGVCGVQEKWMMGNGSSNRVAIACQGGSHTAFTAGVLQGLLGNLPEDVNVVALSGTSGGAICAALAWDGLVRSDPKLAIRKLQGFWESMAASDPWDRIVQ